MESASSWQHDVRNLQTQAKPAQASAIASQEPSASSIILHARQTLPRISASPEGASPGRRCTKIPITGWPQLVETWLGMMGMISG